MKYLLLIMCCLMPKAEALEIDVRDMPLSEVLTRFAAETGVTVSAPDAPDALVTMTSNHDDPRVTLEHIATAAGLEIRGRYPQASLVTPQTTAPDLVVIDLKHREAAYVLELLDQAGVHTGDTLSVLSDPETNRLIVSGPGAALARVEALVSVLDVEVAQILIEARLVSADTERRHQLGIEWSFRTALDGRSGAQGRSPEVSADASAGSLALAFISDPRLLSLELSALEASGAGEVISEPRIVTTNRRPATIRQGSQIPFVTRDENGQSRTEFKDAVLELRVTPVLRDDGQIEMTLEIRQDQVSQITTAQGPAIDTRELNTEVTVEPGQTLVLGGIYESREETLRTGVPGLSELPLIGRAFQTDERRAYKSELLVFITPRVL